MKTFGVLAVLCVSGGAIAQPLDFVVDPAQSSIDLGITITVTGFGSDTDSDSSSVSGSVQASYDDPTAPTETSLFDFQGMIDTDLSYNWIPAPFSTAEAFLTGGMIQYADPGNVVGPVPVVSGAFEFMDVPASLAGTVTVDYSIFLLGSGSEVIDLSTLGAAVTAIPGTVSYADGVVTVTNTISFDGEQPLVLNETEFGVVSFAGTATLVATATFEEACPADLATDGMLNFLDVSAFLSAFGSQDSSADFVPDGMFNFLDVSAFLAAYGAGCP